MGKQMRALVVQKIRQPNKPCVKCSGAADCTRSPTSINDSQPQACRPPKQEAAAVLHKEDLTEGVAGRICCVWAAQNLS